MPNYCWSSIRVRGPEFRLKLFAEKVKGKTRNHVGYDRVITEGEEQAFLLDSVTQMPEVYTGIHKGLCQVSEANASDPAQIGKSFYHWREKVILDETKPQGRLTMILGIELDEIDRMKAEHGAEDWYEWSCQNWGTKWECKVLESAISDTVLLYELETAWSPPIPVLDKLREEFPDLSIDCDWHEEGGERGIA